MQAPQFTAHRTLLSMILGVLVGVISLIFYLFLGAKNDSLEVHRLLTDKAEQFAAAQVQLDSLSLVLDEKIAEVRRLGGDVEKLERIKRQLETDKRKLRYDLTFTSHHYALKISDYQKTLGLNESYLNRLKGEKGALQARTQSLEKEKHSILLENEGLKREKVALAQAVTKYSVENAELEQKINQAAVLKASEIRVSAIAPNGKERHATPLKGSRIDQLRIAFTLMANPLARQGEKDVYVRLLDPNGAVLRENGGGVLWIDGREIGYSVRHTLVYENGDLPAEVLFRREMKYNLGTYAVELYAEEFLIGTGEFRVR